MFLVPGIIVIRCVGTSKNSVLLIFRKRCFRELVAFFIKVAVSGCIQLPNINISLSSNCNSLWPAVRECLTGGFLCAVSLFHTCKSNRPNFGFKLTSWSLGILD